MLDEIGILEKDEQKYLHLLKEAIHTHKNVIGVLKKKEAPHNAWMWTDPEIQILDLDEISFEEALRILEEAYMNRPPSCSFAGQGGRCGFRSQLNDILYFPVPVLLHGRCSFPSWFPDGYQ